MYYIQFLCYVIPAGNCGCDLLCCSSLSHHFAFLFTILKMYWTLCLERGAPQRVNHASVAVEDKIYSFGGYCSEQDMPIFIDVYCFDTNTLKWTKINYEESRDCPQGCYGHSVVAYQHLIYLWGGQNVHGASNILYCFNTKTLSWTKPITSGRFPKPTDGHSACVIGDHMYTFGGFENENDCYSQKVYSLNLITFRWKEVPTFGFLPYKRDFHTASVIGSCMFIFGGRSIEDDDDELEFYPRDIICLNTNTMKWITPVVEGSLPCGRRSHSAVVYKNEIYIIGGYDGNRGKHMNDVYKYNPATSVWTEMKVLGNPPHPRRRHCSVLVGDIVYLFGGSSPDEKALCESSVLKEHYDMHMLEFAPSLKKLSLMKILEHQINFNCLPVSLQSEIKWLASLKLQPVYTSQKRNYTAFAP